MELYEVTQEEYDAMKRRSNAYIQILEEFKDSGFLIAEVVNPEKKAASMKTGLMSASMRGNFNVSVDQIGERVFLIKNS